MIETPEDLKEYFHKSQNPFEDWIYISAKLRRCWMLNSEKTVQKGTVCDLKFTNMTGGVWKAELTKLRASN